MHPPTPPPPRPAAWLQELRHEVDDPELGASGAGRGAWEHQGPKWA